MAVDSADHQVRVRAHLIGGVSQGDDLLLEGGELGLERLGRAVITRTRICCHPISRVALRFRVQTTQ